MTDSSDRLNMRVWLMLAIVGGVLGLIAWYRFLS
jgi:hypothetical protein